MSLLPDRLDEVHTVPPFATSGWQEELRRGTRRLVRRTAVPRFPAELSDGQRVQCIGRGTRRIVRWAAIRARVPAELSEGQRVRVGLVAARAELSEDSGDAVTRRIVRRTAGFQGD